MKSTLRKYCLELEKDWDDGVPLVLFAVHDARHESLGFSPAELVFGHNVRGPLKVLKDQFLSVGQVPKINVLDFVTRCRERLHQACATAKDALCRSQEKIKRQYDKRAVVRNLVPGEKVLVLLPVPGAALAARFSGPYVVKNKVSKTDYIIYTPDGRRKTCLCHVNMLKSYSERSSNIAVTTDVPESMTTKEKVGPVLSLFNVQYSDDGLEVYSEMLNGGCLNNSEFLNSLQEQLSYLDADQKQDIIRLIQNYPVLFNDVPSCTSVLQHDIDVGLASPIKQHAYRCSVDKRNAMKAEVEYLLQNNLAKCSKSLWSSPCVLVPKQDGSVRFCTDFRKVNAVTVPDSFPLPQVEDRIDNLGTVKYITKLDLLKGYWQVPLTPRASDIAAFVTPDHFAQYTRMAFGLRNAPATFQRLMQFWEMLIIVMYTWMMW